MKEVEEQMKRGLTDATEAQSAAARAGDGPTESEAIDVGEASSNVAAECPTAAVVVYHRVEYAKDCP